MRSLLKKLKCNDYLTLVAASSIIRSGIARSGMMHEYIYRFHHPDKFEYIHPVMKKQLEETFGVMVYQEDVLKVCHHFAGLDLADADVLRRAMSGKYRSKLEFQRSTQTGRQYSLTMHFGTFLDDEGEMSDTTHFPDSLRSYPFRGDGIYLILGKVVDDFGYASIDVRKMAKMPFQPDPGRM